MADLSNLNFDANTVEPNSFETIPAGWYNAIITESEWKPSRSNDNVMYLQLKFRIIDGDYKNRVVYDRLNLNHPKHEVVDIARRSLSGICRATGVMTPKDTIELHNLPLAIQVKCRKNETTGEIQNAIGAYKEKMSIVASTKSLEETSPF